MATVTPRSQRQQATASAPRKPRLGFLGIGWIGRHRLTVLANSRVADVAAVADLDIRAVESVQLLVPDAVGCASLEELLDHDLDGVVIATPSALHFEQATRALSKGLAVFCQKPLARTACETREIIEHARSADRLLGVDLSYRYVNGIPQMRELIHSGALGTVYAGELTFHNAYGPDKSWFYDSKLSGGGCLIDLGTHLADLALWCFPDRPIVNLKSTLFKKGQRLRRGSHDVEDYAVAHWDFKNGPAMSLACSWGISAGCDAVIEAKFYGTEGSVSLRNVKGSFYDFFVEQYQGRERLTLAEPPDEWGGRALLDWSQRLERDRCYDASSDHLLHVATLIDRIYDR